MVFILDNFEIWIECDGVGDQWNCAFSLSDEWQLLKPEIHPNSVASEFCRRRKFQFFIFLFQLFPMEISLIFSLKVKKANKIWSHVFGCVFEYSVVFYANCWCGWCCALFSWLSSRSCIGAYSILFGVSESSVCGTHYKVFIHWNVCHRSVSGVITFSEKR